MATASDTDTRAAMAGYRLLPAGSMTATHQTHPTARPTAGCSTSAAASPSPPWRQERAVGWYFISGEETELQIPEQELEKTLKVGVLCSVCFPRQERAVRRRKKVDSQS